MAKLPRFFGRTHPAPRSLQFQSARLLHLFPSFRFVQSQKAWRGELSPTDDSPTYRVLVRWRGLAAPSVWIEEPDVHFKAPHRYSNGSLCLFYPKDRSWKPHLYIADTIVTWTAQWLYFYEKWLECDHQWFGPEAPYPIPPSQRG